MKPVLKNPSAGETKVTTNNDSSNAADDKLEEYVVRLMNLFQTLADAKLRQLKN
jgi:hypothetical protein